MNKPLILYVIGINILLMILFFIDKMNAINKKYRIPEITLLSLSFLGGSIGAIIGMFLFHHKTKKIKFRILVPLSLILNIYICIKILLT